MPCPEMTQQDLDQQRIHALRSTLTNSSTTDLEREQAILQLSQLYADLSLGQEYAQLALSLTANEFGFSKAKTAKIMRSLMDAPAWNSIPNSLPLQIKTCQALIDWCITEHRDILKRGMEALLIKKYLFSCMFAEALSLIATLSHELKKLDDKLSLMEVQLLESQTWFQLKNLPKAKASLTSARAAANSVYCPPMLQAAIDLQSGIVHAEERDFKTGYSYFYEAFDAYFTLDQHQNALNCLKYMILCKIMLNNIDEIQMIISVKSASKYSGPAVEALKQVAAAYKARSLSAFDSALKGGDSELHLLSDPIIKSHLTALYEQLLEQNIMRVIEPYSVVQVTHVAAVIGLEQSIVEGKISQMILDKMICGVIDQGKGCLELFEAEKRHVIFENALLSIKHADSAVDALFEKSRRLQ
jgi:26S proteasome regulatory subunit N6